MKYTTAILLGLFVSNIALANDEVACGKAGGSYLTGQVISGPVFKSGKNFKGVELSHTNLRIKADSDGQVYEVAVDNVFAHAYKKNSKAIPAPLNGIKKGDKLELCGQLYTQGIGIHWVHNNCGKTPTPDKPNGWVKKIDANGALSANFEDLTTYCDLWE